MVPRAKKAKRAGDASAQQLVAADGNNASNAKYRTSSLQAPTMLLTGHLDQVNAVEFHPSGNVLASGSHDKKIFLWNTYGDCSNYCVLSGHKNAVLSAVVYGRRGGAGVVLTGPFGAGMGHDDG